MTRTPRSVPPRSVPLKSLPLRSLSPRSLLSRTPLRVQLVAAFLVLSALAMVLFGTAGTVLLRTNLQTTLDSQLMSFARAVNRPGGLAFGGGGGGGGEGRFGGSASWVGAFDSAGTSLATPYLNPGPDSAQTAPALPKLTAAWAVAASERPFTVRPTGAGSAWRVSVIVEPDGSALVVALTEDGVTGPISKIVTIDLLLGAGILVLLGLAAWLVVQASLRPLVDVEQTAEAIAAGDLSRRVPVTGERTEVGRLGTALNTMLGHIEAAFRDRAASEAAAHATAEQMRRFAADASHELRTPLTSIRGFAELHRSGVIPPGPETDRAMERIENEALRMGGLVEDLLLLARLDQQRPLAWAPVDLLAIAVDAVHDAAAIAPDHVTSLSAAPGADADTDRAVAVPAVVLGDDARLRQVVTNLVANALHHTPPGTHVTVSVATTATQAVLEVADTGPGLSGEDAQRVFERFYRTDSSRTRARGGAGLGLSIVAALVEAHAGSVALRTAPGEGATFRVTLPLATAAVPPAAPAPLTAGGQPRPISSLTR